MCCTISHELWRHLAICLNSATAASDFSDDLIFYLKEKEKGKHPEQKDRKSLFKDKEWEKGLKQLQDLIKRFSRNGKMVGPGPSRCLRAPHHRGPSLPGPIHHWGGKLRSDLHEPPSVAHHSSLSLNVHATNIFLFSFIFLCLAEPELLFSLQPEFLFLVTEPKSKV